MRKPTELKLRMQAGAYAWAFCDRKAKGKLVDKPLMGIPMWRLAAYCRRVSVN